MARKKTETEFALAYQGDLGLPYKASFMVEGRDAVHVQVFHSSHTTDRRMPKAEARNVWATLTGNGWKRVAWSMALQRSIQEAIQNAKGFNPKLDRGDDN